MNDRARVENERNERLGIFGEVGEKVLPDVLIACYKADLISN